MNKWQLFPPFSCPDVSCTVKRKEVLPALKTRNPFFGSQGNEGYSDKKLTPLLTNHSLRANRSFTPCQQTIKFMSVDY